MTRPTAVRVKSYRGPGLKEGLRILQRVSGRNWTCRSFPMSIGSRRSVLPRKCSTSSRSLLFSADRPILSSKLAKTGRVVNIKKGQFLAPWDIRNAAEKAASTGNDKIVITERGVSFGYNNLVADMRSLPIIRGARLSGHLRCHPFGAVARGRGTASSGDRKFVPHLTRAAAAAGIDGLFMEVHACPDKALCDGPNMLSLDELPALLKQVKEIDRIVKA